MNRAGEMIPVKRKKQKKQIIWHISLERVNKGDNKLKLGAGFRKTARLISYVV